MYPHRVGSSQSNLVRRRYGSESENGDDGANGSYVIPASTVRSSTLSADPKEDAAVPASYDFASSASSVSSMSLSNSSRDRTGEFLNAVRSFQVSQVLCAHYCWYAAGQLL